MKAKFLATVALTALATASAMAADLPRRAPAVAAPAYVPVYNWSGLYVGGNVGYGWATASSTATIAGLTGTASERMSGIIGGGQIGYNWQSGAFVFGVEADFQGSNQRKSTTVAGITFTDSLPWFSTFRGRVGVANGTWLWYVTGGGGIAELKSSATAGGLTVSTSDTRGLWTLGGGVEAALSGPWTAKLEYLYLDTGRTSNTVGAATVSTRVHDHILRVGANYRFGAH
jgi:outer membrane immunogenic protein